MTVAILTPVDLADGTVKGKSFRKQILRKQTITYKGKKIDFNDALLSDLAKNFNKGAYDQVPLFFANEKNQHNEDPTRYHGELVGVELTDDGLDGIFSLTAEGRKAVKKNPKLGVSARIMGGVDHADGRKFGASIRHVLATTFPRIQGLKPWEAVSLSDDDEDIEVVDLTAIGTEKEGSHAMATKTKGKKVRTVKRPANGVVTVETSKGQVALDLSSLDDEEFQALLDLSSTFDEGDVVDLDDDEDEDDEEEDEEDDEEDEEDEEEDDEEDDTDLSDDDASDADADHENPTVTKKKGKKGKKPLPEAFVKNQKSARRKKGSGKVSLSLAETLARGEWRRERRELAASGVPPYMLDLAEPIMERPNAIMVDLADDNEADATQVVRGLLEAAKGYHVIKTEMGHVDLSDDEESEAEALLSQWTKEYGPA